MTAETFRDPWGIPHLRAGTADELAWAQGRNAALDRAWQVEWHRRRAEGRTAEVVGRPGLEFDRFARRARIAATAQDCYAALDERTRTWCGAYVDGVNSGLNTGASAAAEFDRLDVDPEPWQPWTPLAVFSVQQLIFGGFGYKLWRRHVARQLGADKIIMFENSADDSPGSNAWAVTGDRTATGMPMIAGDSHRTVDYPGVYQQIRLACPDFDVLGFSFPGVPGIQHFGHAGEVAWTITNAMADYQDLYLEDLRTDGDQVLARGPDGWRPARVCDELIMVRDRQPEPLQTITTERGPVIITEPGGPVMSLRTPTWVDHDLGFTALLPLLRSRSVGDVVAALEHWVEPVNSVLVADRTGAVRHLVAGRVPIRDEANGSQPVPAWDGRHAWSGDYHPMPVRPVEDLMASCNDRDSGGGFGVSYAARWRVRRIRVLLGETGAVPADAETMAAIHRDDLLGSAGYAQQLIGRTEVSGRAESIKNEILSWDTRMAADSRPALLYARWRHALVDWLSHTPQLAALQPIEPLPTTLAGSVDPTTRIGLAVDAVCAHAGELGIDLDVGVAAALHRVADSSVLGSWGDVHRLEPVHALTGLADEHVPPMPGPRLSGDTLAVLATHSTPGVSDSCSMASVTRYVWDLDDRTASRWVVPFGASGCSGDPHEQDQTPSWVAGELLPVITDWDLLTPDD